MPSGHSAVWVTALNNALKAGVPVENFKGVNAFGGNLSSLEDLNGELIECREQVENLKKQLKKAMEDGKKKQEQAAKYGTTMDTQIKMYRKAAFDMEAAYDKLKDTKASQATVQLRAGLDNVEALTSKNINLTFDFTDASIK